MTAGERDKLVAGGLSASANGAAPAPKVNKGRGILCWAIFGVFLLFFIIMAAVYTDPQRYKAASPVSYLTGEDATLYKNLGQVYFVPSTSKMNAMANFQLGLQLLHVFWYDLALVKFHQARVQDPKLAMAYWGEAMCHKQPLWQSEDVAGAQAVLAALNKSVAISSLQPKDQAYIAAAQVLFASNATQRQREMGYMEAMKEIHNEYQDDADACAFYALSILGFLQSTGGALPADWANQLHYQASEVLGDCMDYYPGHAGLLHYATHLYDVSDMEEAKNGIAPALALAKLAPASSVAQHMRSHIFARFGNWSQVVAGNQDAVAASDKYCTAIAAGNSCDADNRWHALEWQIYGQLQECALSGATVSYKRMQSVAASMNYSGDYVQWLYRSYAHMQLSSLGAVGAVPLRNASDNATSMLPPPLYGSASGIKDAADISDHFWPPHAEAHALLARIHSLVWGRTAAQQQAAAATVDAAAKRLDAIVALQTNASAQLNAEMTALLTTVQLQATALVSAAACAANLTSRCTAWQPLMEQAMGLYNNFSGSSTLPSLKIAPTPEFYANLLLLTGGNATQALQLYDICLGQMPGRMTCMLGRARAARALGNTSATRFFYELVVSQCGSAGDARFPALVEAKQALAASPPPPAKKGLLRRRAQV
ncbi:hypothetical protein Agub_g7810 [Astrephomene gubernaculifera]|uniref:Uncharacterized protein n=1 Tax=Astrephomene gubernaculifera TaxID=47775 RepID=A0AAD3DQZ5_9CHLO|nr:hypothetical protein Agub_g7810 [Astrephomene gubernaculifera]